MRLDEWQKFIESQFLEETAVVPVMAKTAPALPLEPQILLPLETELISVATEQIAVSVDGQAAENSSPPPTTEGLVTVPFEAAVPPEGVQARLQQPQTTPRQTGFVVRSDVEPPIVKPEPLPSISPVRFEPTLDFDPVIPDFSDYLPSKSLPQIAPDPVAPAQDAPVVAALFADDETQDAAFIGEESTVGPMSVLMPLTSGFVSQTNLPPQTATSAGEPRSIERRRTRAPQARNVQPENVVSGLTATDLWSQVPRHVQTLLALERREEEREVAQTSYKRPFQEKRAELIARILDPVLSLEDTARLLNVCPTTVRRYTNKGILTHYRKEPERPSANTTERETRQRRFRLSDILTFLETQQGALAADRLNERVAPIRRKRTVTSLEGSELE